MALSIKVSPHKTFIDKHIFFLFHTTSYYNLVCNYYKRGIKYGTRKSKNMLYLPHGELLLSTLGSLYFSEIMKFEPCILCWYQRIFMYPFVLWLGIAQQKDYRIASYSTNCKYWCLYFFISLCNSKVPAFSVAGATCGRVPCTGEFINWFGLLQSVLALIGFITIAVCSFIVIKTNKEMKE